MGKKAELDDKVMKMLKDVRKRRAKIGTLKSPHFTTSQSLDLPGFERLNILVCQDLGKMAMACGTLLRMKSDIESASTELDVEIEPKWQNYSIDDWVKDIKLRVEITQLKAKQAKLATLEAKLRTLTSEEQRREMALADIEAELE